MDLGKVYEPKQVEEKWYAVWMEAGWFHPQPGKGRPYCITIPPPNITGSLHIGHALNNSILDLMTRRRRMQGYNTLCLPGTDHAGIATQNVVERELAREGLTRHDLGREAFVERCWQWRNEYGNRILAQLQKLGCSYDWQRGRFTLDDAYVEAVYEEFIRWWERGLIYRGARVVNWCPRCRSAISDIEVETEERQGKLYTFRYPLADGSSSIAVATTRPETLLGDTAVAVHPDDTRYSHLVGQTVLIPLTWDPDSEPAPSGSLPERWRPAPIIADAHVKMEFGTGAVKVTPAHDLDDFEIGQRHGLAQIVVIGEDGTMTAAAGPRYQGLDRFEARKAVVRDMEELGLLVGTEDYTVMTPLCERCGTVLEPLLSEQWFARMQPELAGPAIRAVEENKVRFIPDRYRRIYLNWMENIRPWCLSRQLWWGHRIPVWWTQDGRCAAARNEQEAAVKLGVPPEALQQDPDVLDTWFSSALWPHATLGWPHTTPELEFWYPTNLLSTAQEILYLWVARMIMTGLDFIKRPAESTPEGDGILEADGHTRAIIPFYDVYVHATILDERGERMSKSKGNGVDPLDMIEKYGADALRFSLLQQAGKNQDIRFSEDRIRLARNFCNKLWNAARFVLTSVEAAGAFPPHPAPAMEGLGIPERWILSRLQATVDVVNRCLDDYDMDDAMRALYSFVWDEFCDWYVEIAKVRLRGDDASCTGALATLAAVLEGILRLAHPAIPFITEEVWQSLKEIARRGDARSWPVFDAATIMFAPYPAQEEEWLDPGAEERMVPIIEATHALRNLRAEAGIEPGRRITGAVVPSSRAAGVTLSDYGEIVCRLARLSTLEIWVEPPAPTEDPTDRWIASHTAAGEVYLHAGEALDLSREMQRALKELERLEADIRKCEARLQNPDFTSRAPAHVVDQERARLHALKEKHSKLAARAKSLGGSAP
ncbi:MAG: valine--tRNA ligase [Chthonomonadales bacterium]